MVQTSADHEQHYIHRTGWLRAAVLGANDGIVSTASLIIGVASASATSSSILVAGTAALVAGAMSMAAGEFVSVSSQSDSEAADLETERAALKTNPTAELQELADIYAMRGVDPQLALQVATQLSAHDALGAHARDELGISEHSTAKPIQAAATSAASFAAGAAVPLCAAVIMPVAHITMSVAVVSLVGLALLGMLSAKAGGAGRLRATVRVVAWGTAAMVVTGLVGTLFGATG